MERLQEPCEWHTVLEEAEELAGLQKRKQNSFNTSDILEPRRTPQGARWRSRFKFSFQQFPKGEDVLSAYSLKDRTYNSCEEDIEVPADWDVFEHRGSENTEAQFCEDVVEESNEVTTRLAFHDQHFEAPSVSELLENLQKTNNLSYERNLVASKCRDKTKGKARETSSSKQTLLHLVDRLLDNEDPRHFKCTDSFVDDKHIDQGSQTNQFDEGKTFLDNSKGKPRSQSTLLPLGDQVFDIEDPLELADADSFGDDKCTDQGSQTNQIKKGQAVLDSTKGKAKQMCSSKQTQLHRGDQVLGIERDFKFLGADSSGNDKSINQLGKRKSILGDSKVKELLKRTGRHLDDGDLDIEDPLDFIGADSSGNDKFAEEGCRVGQFDTGPTMLDLFQSAFHAATEEGPAFHGSNKFGSGYHGRLQKVMQLEKDRDMVYLKQLQAGRKPSSESPCMDVRILSRVLEAKLTVCQCLFYENINARPFQNSGRGQPNPESFRGSSRTGGTLKKTIIFCPRICSTMELEIGSMVRVHPPWKEVEVNGGETIMLCRYFSRFVS